MTDLTATLIASAGGMVPSQHDKNEWSRLAQAAYAAGRNDVGHRYSVAASLRTGEPLPLRFFDELQTGYRGWLVFGEWPLLGERVAASRVMVRA